MNYAADTTLHDASPEASIAAIRAFVGPLLLDLDETLYLRNSTEDFIESARPGVAAALMMQLLDWVEPWRWTGGKPTRDIWRVRLVMLVLPWTAWCWRRRIPQLAEQFRNVALVRVLREHTSVPIVLTMGFRPIVTPLIAALNLGESRIVATRTSSFDDRRGGKMALAEQALGADAIRQGLVVTGSTDDLPLLDACARPLRTLWPGTDDRRAYRDIYLPGRYISRIKLPGERYILRGVLQEDFAFWLIASLSLAGYPFLHIAGLSFLLLSFWTIYECGYVDNDACAAAYEAEPKLSPEFHTLQIERAPWVPWVWASIAAAIAIPLLRWPGTVLASDFAKWALVLLVTYGWFCWYNRVDKQTRVWLYAGLQLARGAAFTVLVPVSVVGSLGLGAHILARWLPYYVYRLGGKEWPVTLLMMTRLLFFVVMMLLFAMTSGLSVLISWTAAALIGWNLFRARHELRAAVVNARRLDRP